MQKILVVTGNSYPIKDSLKRLGFRFSFDNKVWFKNYEQGNIDLAIEFIEQGTNCSYITVNTLSEAFNKIREERKNNYSNDEIVNHSLTGKKVEFKKWYGNILKDELGNDFAFRNVEIKKVYRETQKAILADFKFYGGIMCSCGVCGKTLTDEISKATGIGPVCAKKLGLPRPTLNNVKEVITELNKVVGSMPEVTKKWIPKSQIKNI